MIGSMGCAGSRHGASTKSGADVKSSVLATLTEMDRDGQVVTMQAEDGTLSAVAVADAVIFGRMEAGDKVRIDRKEALGFQILSPGQIMDAEEYSGDALPAGVLFGRKVATTVEILAVADQGGSTTFRCDDGSVHTLDIEAKSARALVASLQPGDNLEVTCTERLAVELVR
jgi:hypothetical protein